MNIGLTEFFFARQLRLERLSIGFGSMHRRRFATLPGLLLSTEIYSLAYCSLYMPFMFIGIKLSV